MAIMRYDPFRVDFPELFSWLRLPESRGMFQDLLHSDIRIEEFVEKDTLVIRAELPGIDPEKDLDITVSDGMLTIRAERRDEKKEGDEKKGFRSEMHYGSFSRSLALPGGVNEQDVKATYHDGILEVRLPIGSAEKPAVKVPIQRG